MIKKWEKESGSWKPFTPGERSYPVLGPELRKQLDLVLPSTNGFMRYYPCQLRLKDGSEQDFVYVSEAGEYLRSWGVWPDQDSGKRQ